jgi:hypothetical protein
LMGPTPPLSKYTLEKTESVIENGQSKDRGKLYTEDTQEATVLLIFNAYFFLSPVTANTFN